MTFQRDARRDRAKPPSAPLWPPSEDVWTFAGKPLPILNVDDPTPSGAPLWPPSEDFWTFAGKPLPIMYEDEGQEEMGDANLHTLAIEILHLGIIAHLSGRPQLQVFSDLDCYYDPAHRRAYFSADVMVVKPFQRLPRDLRSYRIGKHGPAPLLTIEVLSRRWHQQRDVTDKSALYGQLGVAEYIIADMSGKYMPERLGLSRRRRNGTWRELRDRDGGVTSRLRFRIVSDDDGDFRIVDAATGKRYLRPAEAQAAEEQREKAEDRVRQLEAELQRLRRKQRPRP